jgi:hypothetical protein
MLISAIGLGAPRYVAAIKAGLDEKTLRNWLDRGETDDEGNPVDERPGAAEFVEFRQEFLKAEAEAEQLMVDAIRVNPDWKASAWMLERRHPDRWGQKTKLEHSGEFTANVVTGVVMLPAEDGTDGEGSGS